MELCRALGDTASRNAEVLSLRNLSGRVLGEVGGLADFTLDGGGIPLLVLLTKWAGVEEKKAFATCVAVIFPMCAVSATLYLWRAELSLLTALPYLLGGFAGGLVGGKLFRKVPGLWLRRIFALFLLYGGWRSHGKSPSVSGLFRPLSARPG